MYLSPNPSVCALYFSSRFWLYFCAICDLMINVAFDHEIPCVFSTGESLQTLSTLPEIVGQEVFCLCEDHNNSWRKFQKRKVNATKMFLERDCFYFYLIHPIPRNNTKTRRSCSTVPNYGAMILYVVVHAIYNVSVFNATRLHRHRKPMF